MKWLKKVAETPLTVVAKVIDSLQAQANDRTNAPSIHAVRAGLEDLSGTIPEVKDSLAEATGDRTNAPSIHVVRNGFNNVSNEITNVNTSLVAAINTINANKANNNIVADAYDATATYAVGDYCIYNNVLYKCNTAIEIGETFDAIKWDATELTTDIKWLNNMVKGTSGVSFTVAESGMTKRDVINALFALLDKDKITPHSKFIFYGIAGTDYYSLYSKAIDNSVLKYSYLDEVTSVPDHIFVGHFAEIRGNADTKLYYVFGRESDNYRDESSQSATVGTTYAICY